jgi:hypothetical protein
VLVHPSVPLLHAVGEARRFRLVAGRLFVALCRRRRPMAKPPLNRLDRQPVDHGRVAGGAVPQLVRASVQVETEARHSLAKPVQEHLLAEVSQLSVRPGSPGQVAEDRRQPAEADPRQRKAFVDLACLRSHVELLRVQEEPHVVLPAGGAGGTNVLPVILTRSLGKRRKPSQPIINARAISLHFFDNIHPINAMTANFGSGARLYTWASRRKPRSAARVAGRFPATARPISGWKCVTAASK